MAGGIRSGGIAPPMTADASGGNPGRRAPDRSGRKTAEGMYNDLDSVSVNKNAN